MAEELLFTIDKKTPIPAKQVGLAEVGLKERQDVEEWVIAHPQILGSDVLIVTSEFAGWATKKGDKDSDRLDVVGLASDGRLVVVELKRGKAASTIEMQALNYAARANLFTASKLALVHQRFLKGRNIDMSVAAARGRLEDHAADFSDETVWQVPRIVLVATEFGLDVTTTAVFLKRKLGVEIELIQLRAYKTASGDLVVSVSKIFPPPDMDEMVLFPRADEDQEGIPESTRERNTVARLLAADAIPDGTALRLEPGSEMTLQARNLVKAWMVEDPERSRASWVAHPVTPLRWEVDGKPYSPTGLVKHIARQAGVDIRAIAGPRSWRDAQNRTLPEIASLHDGQ